jgi:UDPglucose--hexose-1-phosphate uridylyltransferase
VIRTPIRLADGRELVYFDADGAPARATNDRRRLPRLKPPIELRRDPLLDEWVVVASHRQERAHLPPEAECPLCPSTPERATEIPAFDYDVVVFENRFPPFATSPAELSPLPGADDAVERRPALGRCEVVCFTSHHDGSFAGLSVERARLVMDVWADRTRALGALEGVEQVFCFENRGEEIGVTLHHPHGQIYAYPFVTPRTQRMLEAARRHREATGGDLFAELLAGERAARMRVVVETEHWTAFVPPFARWPFEVHIYPRRRVPDLPALDGDERDDFVRLYLDLLLRFDSLFSRPLPYIAAWHQAPVRTGRDLAHLHLQLFSARRAADKLKYLAASESGMDVWINDVPPEKAARLLRAAGSDPQSQ